jgi:NAD(P)-dependent dehydrogenase (short-subunit alcohol dehydrogenase family)
MIRVCTVVGVGPGIGRAVARRFAREGFAVGLVTRSADAGERFAAAIAATGARAVSVAADAGDAPALRAALDRLRSSLGEPSVLVYNASSSHAAAPSGLDPADLEADFRISVTGALVAVQHVLPAMLAAGRGTVLLTGGGLALAPSVEAPSLAVGKAGLRSLALSLAAELAPAGIHVATVTVAGFVQPGTRFDPDRIAEEYWRLHLQEAGRWESEVVFR